MLCAFVVDTSASMAQPGFNGMSALDCAKSIVELVVRIRERNDPMRGDKYFLVTTEDGAGATRCGWSSTPQQFMDQLKSLAPCAGSGDLGRAVMRGLNLLNERRLADNRDTFGCGTRPWKAQPGICVVLTDGASGSLSAVVEGRGMQGRLVLPRELSVVPASLAREPYFWDQHIIGALVRVPVVAESETALRQAQIRDLPFAAAHDVPGLHHPSDPRTEWWRRKPTPASAPSLLRQLPQAPIVGELRSVAEATGGTLNHVTSVRSLRGFADGLASHMATAARGTVLTVRYLKGPPRQGSPLHSVFRGEDCVARILPTREGPGTWPIPELFWPQADMAALPPRPPRPEVAVDLSRAAPALENLDFLVEKARFPIDVYTLHIGFLHQRFAEAWPHMASYAGRGTFPGAREGMRTARLLVYVRNSDNRPGCVAPCGLLHVTNTRRSGSQSTPAPSDLEIRLIILVPRFHEVCGILCEVVRPKLAQREPLRPGEVLPLNDVRGEEWDRRFRACLRALPPYLHPTMKRVLAPFGLSALVPNEPEMPTRIASAVNSATTALNQELVSRASLHAAQKQRERLASERGARVRATEQLDALHAMFPGGGPSSNGGRGDQPAAQDGALSTEHSAPNGSSAAPVPPAGGAGGAGGDSARGAEPALRASAQLTDSDFAVPAPHTAVVGRSDTGARTAAPASTAGGGGMEEEEEEGKEEAEEEKEEEGKVEPSSRAPGETASARSQRAALQGGPESKRVRSEDAATLSLDAAKDSTCKLHWHAALRSAGSGADAVSAAFTRARARHTARRSADPEREQAALATPAVWRGDVTGAPPLAPAQMRTMVEDKARMLRVGEMGNFLRVLANKHTLRDPLSEGNGQPDPISQRTFGSPYRRVTKSKSGVPDDEAQAAAADGLELGTAMTGASPADPGSRKRDSPSGRGGGEEGDAGKKRWSVPSGSLDQPAAQLWALAGSLAAGAAVV